MEVMVVVMEKGDAMGEMKELQEVEEVAMEKEVVEVAMEKEVAMIYSTVFEVRRSGLFLE